MTDVARTERLAALRARRTANSSGARRRPAEAARILVAGAGATAVLTMMTAMARADQVIAESTSSVPPLVEELDPVVPTTAGTTADTTPVATVAPATTTPPVQTVTVTPAKTVTVSRPARAATNTRTNGSR